MTEDYKISIQTKQREMAAEAADVYTTVYSYLYKTYLNEIDAMEVVPLKDSSIDGRSSINFRLVEITRIVHDNKKSALENLLNILAALHPDYTVALIIKSDGNETKFYIGIRSSSQSKPASSGAKLLGQALEGSFPGSAHRLLRDSEVSTVIDTKEMQDIHTWAMGSTSLIPSLKHDDAEQFSQGLERFIDAMYGKKYTAMILAEPVNHEQLLTVQSGYEGMATALSVHQKSQLSIGVNRSQALSESITRGDTETLSESITRTQSYTKNTSKYELKTSETTLDRVDGIKDLGRTIGGVVDAFWPMGNLSFGSIGEGLGSFVGKTFVGDKSKSEKQESSDQENVTDERNWIKEETRSESTSETEGTSSTTGESETIGFEMNNKGVERMLAKIDQQLKRIDESRSYGFWNASFYVIGDTSESAHTACSLFKGILKGKDSTIEDSAITIWDNQDEVRRSNTLEYFENIAHPRFILQSADSGNQKQTVVTPSSLLSGKELALLMNFPRKSVSGTLVLELPSFGRNVVYHSSAPQKADTIKLGSVFHYGQELKDSEVRLSLDSLTMNTFITGSVGSGKANTVHKMVREIMRHKKPFLIIEPAKGEYKDLLGGNPDVHVFGTNPAHAPLLKLNLFEFPDDVHVMEHIDRLVELFKACWPMDATMTAVLKRAIELAYVYSGWETDQSRNRRVIREYPTINELLYQLRNYIDDRDDPGDEMRFYCSSLVAKVVSLKSGIYASIFDDHSIDNETLFDSNCIIDLSRVASVETKTLLMGLVLLKLHEHRQSQNLLSEELKHVTVIEEAHQLLRRTSQDQYQGSANLQGKSVEMITNAIAEMKSYGEGFIFVDQSPGLLDPAVIRNTNTKIILRLPEESDRMATGGSAFLDEAQMAEIPRFPKDVAVVFQNEWMTPVLCKVDLVEDKQPLKCEREEKENPER